MAKKWVLGKYEERKKADGEEWKMSFKERIIFQSGSYISSNTNVVLPQGLLYVPCYTILSPGVLMSLL